MQESCKRVVMWAPKPNCTSSVSNSAGDGHPWRNLLHLASLPVQCRGHQSRTSHSFCQRGRFFGPPPSWPAEPAHIRNGPLLAIFLNKSFVARASAQEQLSSCDASYQRQCQLFRRAVALHTVSCQCGRFSGPPGGICGISRLTICPSGEMLGACVGTNSCFDSGRILSLWPLLPSSHLDLSAVGQRS